MTMKYRSCNTKNILCLDNPKIWVSLSFVVFLDICFENLSLIIIEHSKDHEVKTNYPQKKTTNRERRE